jgi:glyoxylase-like metal-dependent hydrolase (beta-lactamase superfamily II)
MPDRVHTLDLHFQDRSHTIAAYLLPHAEGAALIETGPGSTVDSLRAQLAEHDHSLDDITEVFVTHIHLDHAGAAGRLATKHGATVYAHAVGAPHLATPERLLKSAERIYGDDMDRLWGDTLPVPEDQLVSLHDGARVNIGDRTVVALDTPGHASHHLAYVVGDVCFTGDVAGVRLPGETYVEVPLVPPELRLDHWRESLDYLRTALPERDVTHLALTHFGLFDDVTPHLDRLEAGLDAADDYVRTTLPDLVDDEDALRDATVEWVHDHARSQGVDEDTWALYELADPSWMAASGLRRYWEKHVQA